MLREEPLNSAFGALALREDGSEKPPYLAPWEADPRRLWSIRDMEKFRVDVLAMFSWYMGESVENTRLMTVLPGIVKTIVDGVAESTCQDVARTLAKQVNEQSQGKVTVNVDNLKYLPSNLGGQMTEQLTQEARAHNKVVLQDASEVAEFFKLPGRWDSKAKRILEAIETSDAQTLHVLTRTLIDDLKDALSEPRFLYISPAKKPYFDQDEPPFGQTVADKFSDASRDIAAASRCFALDEWTACVSHLMRALECPLQVFADRIGVKFPGPTDLENWKNIVDQMASKIEAEEKRLEGTPKNHERNQELKFLGDVALDFRHFKNAWRNDVSHGREWYDEREAKRVYDAAQHFMQRMAEIA